MMEDSMPTKEDDLPIDRDSVFEFVSRTRVHDGFLKLDICEVRQALFSGGTSPVLHREVLIAHKAVAALCYDPERDVVVMVEQARLPAELAGFPGIQTEIVAGLIDPGETPEEVVRREVKEESGLDVIGAPILIAHALSTPGHSTEQVWVYCARVVAPDTTGYFGLPEEHEDIRTVIVPYREFTEWLANGRVTHGFALMAGFWLMAHREQVRAAWLGESSIGA
jgi:ADP-ribose pyrophosphatase